MKDMFLKIMHDLFSKKKGYEEDKIFFSNEENLYDAEGEPTLAYKNKIKEYEEFIRNCNLNAQIKEIVNEDENGNKMIDAAFKLIDERKHALDKLKADRKREGTYFSIFSWLEKEFEEQGASKEEVESVIKAIEEFIDKENLDLLDDDVLQEVLQRAFDDFANEEKQKGGIL